MESQAATAAARDSANPIQEFNTPILKDHGRSSYNQTENGCNLHPTIDDIPGSGPDNPNGLLPPTRKHTVMLSITPSTPSTRGDTFQRFVRPYYGPKANVFHSPRWLGGSLRLIFYNYEEAVRLKKRMEKDHKGEVEVGIRAAEVSLRIVGLEPSICQAEVEEFKELYGLSSLKILCNKEGQPIPVAFGKAPLHTAQLLDRSRHGGFNGCGVTFELAKSYEEDLWVFPHCANCHRWGHWAQGCRHPRRCGRCGSSDHGLCEENTPSCSNCKGTHPGWSRRCPHFRTYRNCWAHLLGGNTTDIPECRPPDGNTTSTSQQPQNQGANLTADTIEGLNKAWEARFRTFSKSIEDLIAGLIQRAFGSLLGICNPSTPAISPPETKKRALCNPPPPINLAISKDSAGNWTTISPKLRKVKLGAGRSSSMAATPS